MMQSSISIKNIARDIVVYFLFCAIVFAFLFTIAKYASFNTHVLFLSRKQDYIHIKVWRVAFYIHVFTAVIALMAGFTQFSNIILKEHKSLHRIIGKIYAYDILLINFPTGIIMGIYANGGLSSKIAFLLLDFLWFLFTYKAVIYIKQRKILLHKNYMLRSYALTFSAVTLRLWKILLSHTTSLPYDTIYMIIAWMGYAPNLLLVEWMIRKKKTPIG